MPTAEVLEPALPIQPREATWAPEPCLLDGFLEFMAYTCAFLELAPAAQPGFSEVSGQYDLLLQRAEAFKAEAGFQDPAWSDALFAVCAWADERILCSGWAGRAAWLQAQLQRRRFQTTRGGELFFERLAALPPAAVQERTVFDYCLSLGFQGRYFEPEHQATLRSIQARNRALLPGPALDDPGQELFPEAARSLVPDRPSRRLPLGALTYAVLFLAPPALFALVHWGFKAILEGLLMKFRS